MKLNPHFRSADEVETPGNLRDLCGWSDQVDPIESDLIDTEQRVFGELVEESPATFTERIARTPLDAMFERWTQFQADKGRYAGSADWSLLDEFAHGSPLVWFPQIIGSCVVSNTFRRWVDRLTYQIVFLGESMEHLGRNESGPENYSPYGPFWYGLARQKANMRRGDGLYAGPMVWAMMQGALRSDDERLAGILQRAGLNAASDFPEPQGRDGAELYRRFGRHEFVNELKPRIQYPLGESLDVTSADQLWDLLQAGKPSFKCSMEAIHKVGEHPDGFAIHARNRRDSWAHNMSFAGCFISSDGERWFRESNESWGAQHIYNRAFDEVDRAFRGGGLTVRAIGEIEGPESQPPQFAA
ncbi:MAG: hypothetical protein AAFX06_32235 [Planctomycetota bacterium]